MEIQVRKAKAEDAAQMLSLYNNSTQTFVGAASRDQKTYRRMLRRKEKTCLVARDKQGETVGYVSTRFDQRRREARIEEIIVDSTHDFEEVAKPLVDKAYQALMEKKPATLIAGSIRDPRNEKIFPALGFHAFDSTGVFMYAILDTPKFLNELAPVFASRLKKMQTLSGLIQIECDGQGIFLQKSHGAVEPFVWTNQPVDFKVILTRDVLTKLVFGVADPVESLKAGELKVQATLSQERTKKLLSALFPRKQFLILDHW